MQLQRNDLSNQVLNKLESMPVEELEHMLGLDNEPTRPKQQLSKWAKIAQRLQSDPDLHDPEFQKAWQKVKEGMREVHDNFSFQHDK